MSGTESLKFQIYGRVTLILVTLTYRQIEIIKVTFMVDEIISKIPPVILNHIKQVPKTTTLKQNISQSMAPVPKTHQGAETPCAMARWRRAPRWRIGPPPAALQRSDADLLIFGNGSSH